MRQNSPFALNNGKSDEVQGASDGIILVYMPARRAKQFADFTCLT